MLSPLQTMAHGGCGCKDPHIGYTAAALRRRRVASPTLGRSYTLGKPPVLILQEAEWTPGPVWTWTEEMREKYKERII